MPLGTSMAKASQGSLVTRSDMAAMPTQPKPKYKVSRTHRGPARRTHDVTKGRTAKLGAGARDHSINCDLTDDYF